MAIMVVVINTPDSIAQINAKVQNPGNQHEMGARLLDYVAGVNNGTISGGATIQVTSRDTDPSVATSGVGSQQVLYTFS